MAKINLTFDLQSDDSDKIAAAVGAAMDGDLAPAKALGAKIEHVSAWSPDEDDGEPTEADGWLPDGSWKP